jgi:hypothetical protein
MQPVAFNRYEDYQLLSIAATLNRRRYRNVQTPGSRSSQAEACHRRPSDVVRRPTSPTTDQMPSEQLCIPPRELVGSHQSRHEGVGLFKQRWLSGMQQLFCRISTGDLRSFNIEEIKVASIVAARFTRHLQ